jgi:hypothetical protein
LQECISFVLVHPIFGKPIAINHGRVFLACYSYAKELRLFRTSHGLDRRGAIRFEKFQNIDPFYTRREPFE